MVMQAEWGLQTPAKNHNWLKANGSREYQDEKGASVNLGKIVKIIFVQNLVAHTMRLYGI